MRGLPSYPCAMWFGDVGLDTRAFLDGAVKVPGEVEDGLPELLILLFLLAVMAEGEEIAIASG